MQDLQSPTGIQRVSDDRFAGKNSNARWRLDLILFYPQWKRIVIPCDEAPHYRNLWFCR